MHPPTPSFALRGVIFDLDGTLVHQELDFEAIRRELNFPTQTPLLEAVEQLPEVERRQARAILHRHEHAAASRAEPHQGVAEVLAWLDANRLQRGVLSRNCRAAVLHVLERCRLSFDPQLVLGREDAPYKPSPHGLWHICTSWNLQPAEVLMVGDYLYDIQAGRNAGTRTALITHGKDWPFADQADLTLPSIADLPSRLQHWV